MISEALYKCTRRN